MFILQSVCRSCFLLLVESHRGHLLAHCSYLVYDLPDAVPHPVHANQDVSG